MQDDINQVLPVEGTIYLPEARFTCRRHGFKFQISNF
jgi:hypothetical protein